MGTPLGPKYIPYTYRDPLGKDLGFGIYGACDLGSGVVGFGDFRVLAFGVYGLLLCAWAGGAAEG